VVVHAQPLVDEPNREAGGLLMATCGATIESILDWIGETEAGRTHHVVQCSVRSYSASRASPTPADYGLGVVRLALQRATDAGALRPLPLDTLSHTVLGALTETALLVARSEDPQAARHEAIEVVHALLDGLRTPAM
jgi:hypothetical protein